MWQKQGLLFLLEIISMYGGMFRRIFYEANLIFVDKLFGETLLMAFLQKLVGKLFGGIF